MLTNIHKEITRTLISRGYKNASLWVLEENINARRFYEKIGFNHEF
jgi:ribosomal protein S18 acetylase RimI-like enzyme